MSNGMARSVLLPSILLHRHAIGDRHHGWRRRPVWRPVADAYSQNKSPRTGKGANYLVSAFTI
jgi:hypothetical protein